MFIDEAAGSCGPSVWAAVIVDRQANRCRRIRTVAQRGISFYDKTLRNMVYGTEDTKVVRVPVIEHCRRSSAIMRRESSQHDAIARELAVNVFGP